MLFHLLGIFLSMNQVQAQDSCLEDKSSLEQNLSHVLLRERCKRFNITGKEVLSNPGLIHPMVLKFYRQTERKLVDPIADYALVHPVNSNLKKSFLSVAGVHREDDPQVVEDAKACAELLFDLPPAEIPLFSMLPNYNDTEEAQEEKRLLELILVPYKEEEKNLIRQRYGEGKLYFESRQSPIEPEAMALRMIAVIQDEEKKGLLISEGDRHKWSDEFKNNTKTFSTNKLKTIPSKLLTTLSTGRSSGVLVTGKEKELGLFIGTAGDQTLGPEDLFRKSLQLNEGNVYMAILSIENVLSKDWISPRRAELVQTQKLKPFAKKFGARSDVFGHWYHLYGMVLYGFAEGSAMAAIAGRTEAVGSLLISRFKDEKQETRINMDGGKVGGHLKSYFKHKSQGKPFQLQARAPAFDDREELLKAKIDDILKKDMKDKSK